mgnify:CR=1 FL=1
MNKKLHSEAVDQLFEAILCLKNKEECYTFFEDVCTINELLSLSQRFEVAKMLREKSPVIPHVSVGCAAFDSGKETLEEVVSGGRTRWCMKISAVIGS